jgi:predicted Zn-dependent protease
VDLATGSIADVHSVESADLFTLVDSGTARLVIAHGDSTLRGSIAGVTTHSAAAYRLYAEGVQTLADGDLGGADRLFAAALREDSTFAMAAYYYARSSGMRVPMVRRLNRALRLSSNATQRERWLIRAGWAWMVTSPELGAFADSLVRRYPQEPEGHFYSAVARFQDGEYVPAIAFLRRVVAMDSGSFARADGVAGCNACTAMSQMVLAYAAADSLAAAEREARRWTRLQPNIPAPWLSLWDVLERAGKFAESDKLVERITALDDDAAAAVARAATHALRMGDLTRGEQLVRAALQTGNSDVQREALWQLVISLRNQGRLRDAIAAAERYRSLAGPLDSAGPGKVSSASAPLAVALYEAGQYRKSAALFDSISRWRPPDEAASGAARERVWRLTHKARALASAGDTAAVVALVDTIAAVGAVSGHVRDRRLDRYVRGLVLLARNDLVGAEAAFQSALYSLPTGYTRVNCELATVLLRRGRPREAIRVLQPALRGKVDASNYYVTYAEVHALLAQAWDAAGRADSAAVHHAWVARAWEHGDKQFAERALLARRR